MEPLNRQKDTATRRSVTYDSSTRFGEQHTMAEMKGGGGVADVPPNGRPMTALGSPKGDLQVACTEGSRSGIYSKVMGTVWKTATHGEKYGS